MESYLRNRFPKMNMSSFFSQSHSLSFGVSQGRLTAFHCSLNLNLNINRAYRNAMLGQILGAPFVPSSRKKADPQLDIPSDSVVVKFTQELELGNVSKALEK